MKRFAVFVLVLFLWVSSGVQSPAAAAEYDADKALEYAYNNWYTGPYTNDCVGFVSRCLAQGGITIPNKAMYQSTDKVLPHKDYADSNQSLGAYTNPSKAVQAFLLYMKQQGYQIIENPTPAQIDVGDVLSLHDSSPYRHVVMVNAVKGGTIYFTGHTTNRWNRSTGATKIWFVVKLNGTSKKTWSADSRTDVYFNMTKYPDGHLSDPDSFKTAGKVCSPACILNLTEEIQDTNGKVLQSTKYTDTSSTKRSEVFINVKENGSTYNHMNSTLDFSRLSPGIYRYVIKATTFKDTAKTFESTFTMGSGSPPEKTYSGSEFTADPQLAEKLDAVFTAYPPNWAFWPGMEYVDDIYLGAKNAAAYSKSLQFARWCFYQLFGCVDSVRTGEEGKYTFTQLLSYAELRDQSQSEIAAKLKQDLQGVACGSNLRIAYLHSYILLSADENGVTVLDADRDGSAQICLNELTYSQIAEKIKESYSIWGATKDDITVYLHQPYVDTTVYSGSEFTADAELAEKLDGVFAAYPPNRSYWPGMEYVDGLYLGAKNAAAYSKSLQFARWCFYQLFGCVDSVRTGEEGKYTFTQLLSYAELRDQSQSEIAAKLKQDLQSVACGSNLRIAYLHSYILLAADENGVTVLDADRDGSAQICLNELTYSQIAEKIKESYSIWGATKDDITVYLHQPAADAPDAPKVPTVSGTVSGGVKNATVSIVVNGEPKEVPVNADGSFALDAVEGKFDVVVKTPGALSYTVKNVSAENGDIVLPEIAPVKGDTNGDDMINIMDMAAFRQNFGKTGAAVQNAFTDTNGDGMVNIMDMGTFRMNFGKTAAKDCTVEYTA